MKNSKSLGEYGILAFCTALVAATKDGWEIDEWHPPTDMGGFIVCNLLRDEAEEFKPSRAEILAKARAAKAAKAEAPVLAPEAPLAAPEAADQGGGSSEAPIDAPAASEAVEDAPKSE